MQSLILIILLSAVPGFSQDMARADAALAKYSQAVTDMDSVFSANCATEEVFDIS
jgi:hypothetical protein